MSKRTRIELVLEVEDDTLVDLGDKTGLTGEAFDALSHRLANEGYTIVSGPVLVEGSDG